MLFAVSILALFALAAGTQCPPHGSVRYMLPHETDCSKFYICAHGVPILQSCPEGTHFNPSFMNCQNPVFAGCSNELPESDLECTRQEFEVFRPHPDTCSKFYICEHGTPIVFDCPGGTEFSVELKQCVWPHESNCNISEVTAPPQDGGSQNGRCVEGALSPNSDCSKYNICNHGAQVVMNCPPGLQWSSKVKQCVWPRESDCYVPQVTTTTEAPQNGRCVNGALSAHEDCTKYNICNHGAQLPMDCPHGLQWSSKVQQCVWPHESDCNNGSQDGSEPDAPQDGGSQDGGSCDEHGALSAHEDCSKFYKCSFGVNVAMDCPSGLHWNAPLQYCDWPQTAGCS